jgi:hypothetical protein
VWGIVYFVLSQTGLGDYLAREMGSGLAIFGIFFMGASGLAIGIGFLVAVILTIVSVVKND